MTKCRRGEKEHRIENGNHDEVWKKWKETQNTEWKSWRDEANVEKRHKI